MIIEPHWEYHQDLAVFMDNPMLVLGNQQTRLAHDRGIETTRQAFAALGVEDFKTLDPDGGDLQLDLNEDLGDLAGKWSTVYNIGTIEHVWNVHFAWANALRAVKLDGTFLTVTPIQGWAGHGIHVTESSAILNFIHRNGFDILRHTASVDSRGVNLWLAARKTRHIKNIADFECPQQTYNNGIKRKAA